MLELSDYLVLYVGLAIIWLAIGCLTLDLIRLFLRMAFPKPKPPRPWEVREALKPALTPIPPPTTPEDLALLLKELARHHEVAPLPVRITGPDIERGATDLAFLLGVVRRLGVI